MNKIVTMQDLSCYGKCSSTIALPVLSALGQETTLLPTAVLSTHTGYPDAALLDLSDFMLTILDHWKSQSLSFDAAYTGYLSSGNQLNTAVRLFSEFLNPGALRFVDPVMGDHGKLYRGFDDAFVGKMKELCAIADFVFPNLTELFLLTDTPIENRPYEEIRTLADALMIKLAAAGPRYVVLTGTEQTAPDGTSLIGARIYDRETAQFTDALTRKEARMFPGTGDLFCSIFVGSYLKNHSISKAADLAVRFVAASIHYTLEHPQEGSVSKSVLFEPLLHLLCDEIPSA